MNMFNNRARCNTWFVVGLLGLLIAGCSREKDPILGGSKLPSLAPFVTVVTPAVDAIAVPLDTLINATLNEPVSLATNASFSVTCDSPCSGVAGTMSLDAGHKIVKFTPETALSPLTLYVATFNGVVSLHTGLPMDQAYQWHFTTGAIADATPPTVTATVPVTSVPGPTGDISIDTLISATFSEDMAPASINAANFTVTCAAPCVSPSGGVSYDLNNHSANFTPGAALDVNTTYTARISSAVTDKAGNALSGNVGAPGTASDYVWTFSTQVPPTVTAVAPVNNADAVPTNISIATALFSEQMSLAGAGSFVLSCAAPCVNPTGVVSLDATKRIAAFSLTPGQLLAANTLYTATVKDASSLATGLAMVNPFVWHFSTGLVVDNTRPRVALTVPATTIPGPTLNVPTNTAITVVFTEDMAPATINAASVTLKCAAPCVSPVGAVSYAVGTRTAEFTPATVLAVGTTYTATITTAATDLAGNTLSGNQAPLPAASNYIWTFTTQSAVAPPTVTGVAPVDNATNVPINNTIITASFSEPMQAITGSASFVLTCAAPCVNPTGSVALNGSSRIATYTLTSPASLTAQTLYTATVTGARSIATGLALSHPFVWHFTTGIAADVTKPRVTVTEPITTIPGPTLGVPSNTVITARFTEDMAPGTIDSASFTLTCVAPCVSPAGNVNYTVGSRTAAFVPVALLVPATTYTATITTAAKDLAGNALAGNQAPLPAASNYVWTFTTDVAPDTTRPRVTVTVPVTSNPGPTNGVSANTAISAEFTEDMDPATITAASFTVKCSLPCVSPAGVVSYTVGTRTAAFVPSAPLAAGETYTATVSTFAKDLAGNALAGNQAPLPAASDYVWTFTSAEPLSVLSTVPIKAALAVCPNATVNATFGVPSGTRMDPLTVNSTTFTVTGPGPAFAPVVAASVVIDNASGHIATFTPLALLTTGNTYTAVIKGGSTGVMDRAIPANHMNGNYTWTFTVGPATGACLIPIDLGSGSPFGNFGGNAGMTNSGLQTVVNGDIGTTAVSTLVTGFHDVGPGCIYTETPLNVGTVNGRIYTSAPPPTVACPTEGTAATALIASKARADILIAYNKMVALPMGPDPGAGSLAGLVLTPGVYTAAGGSFMIQGSDLTLDGQGNANGVWVFQMATTLTVGGPGASFPRNIILVNGAQAKNVFWQVGSAATINAAGGGNFVGTIVSQAGTAVSTAGNTAIVTVDGRLLSLGAAVTVVDTVINVPAP